MTTQTALNPSALASLRRNWGWLASLACALFAAGYYGMSLTWSPLFALRWLALAGLVLAYQLGSLWGLLGQNHRQGERRLLPSFGPGNALSLTRGAIIAALAGFLLMPRPPGSLAWLPLILYILSDFTDFFDGYLARAARHATRLGETLDVRYDALGVLVVTLLAFRYGTVPVWYLPVGAARYLFLFGVWWRERRGLPVYELEPSAARRTLAGIQMGFVTAVLAPVFSPPGTTIAATLFMLPFLGGFLYDWLTVSGRVGPASPQASRFWQVTWRLLSDWAPLVLRAAAVAVLAAGIYHLAVDYPEQVARYSRLGLPGASRTLLVFAALEGIILLTLGLGVLGRTFSVSGLLLAGLKLQYDSFTATYWILMIAYTALLFLGTGAYSLWKPEDWLIHNRAGESRAS